jgi:D-xylose transport system ATP-binding protein
MDEGQIVFDGQPVSIASPKAAEKLGIEVVYQDLALCDNLDVVQNMFLGRETHDVFQRLKEPPMEAKAVETLAGLRVTTIKSIRQTVATLSGGQRQSVAVARAVMWNSRLVILDEPTAALGVAQTEQVLELVNRLAEQGLGVVLISHNLHDIFETATRITVLRLGRNAGVYERAKTTQEEVVHAITAGTPTKVARIPGTQVDGMTSRLRSSGRSPRAPSRCVRLQSASAPATSGAGRWSSRSFSSSSCSARPRRTSSRRRTSRTSSRRCRAHACSPTASSSCSDRRDRSFGELRQRVAAVVVQGQLPAALTCPGTSASSLGSWQRARSVLSRDR